MVFENGIYQVFRENIIRTKKGWSFLKDFNQPTREIVLYIRLSSMRWWWTVTNFCKNTYSNSKSLKNEILERKTWLLGVDDTVESWEKSVLDLGEHVLELNGLVAALQIGDGDSGRTSLRECMDQSELLAIVRLEFVKVLRNVGGPLLLKLEITGESMAGSVRKMVLSVWGKLTRVVLLLVIIFVVFLNVFVDSNVKSFFEDIR